VGGQRVGGVGRAGSREEQSGRVGGAVCVGGGGGGGGSAALTRRRAEGGERAGSSWERGGRVGSGGEGWVGWGRRCTVDIEHLGAGTAVLGGELL
jgi:hypothetical protein